MFGGIGVRHKFFKDFYFSFDGGWYEPKNDTSIQTFPETTLSEGLWLYLDKYLGKERIWEYYTLKYQGAMGASVNLDYSKAISKSWNIGLSIGYRYLNFNEKIKGKDFGNVTGWWEIKQPRDLSAALISFTITKEF